MNPTVLSQRWSKNWSGKFSVFLNSFSVFTYTQWCPAYFGAGLHNLIYIHKGRISTCYMLRSEMDAFGKKLAKMIEQKEGLVEKWAGIVAKAADETRAAMKKPASSLLEKWEFLHLVENQKLYEPYMVAIKLSSDFFSEKTATRYIPLLQKVRESTEDIYQDLEGYLETLMRIVAKKERCSPEQLLCLTFTEFIEYLETEKLPDSAILQQRFDSCALVVEDDKPSFILKPDSALESRLAKSYLSAELKGKTAYPGKAMGVCRIILDPSKNSPFDEGDILITNMTRPDFLPLMRKAAAIVTDAGGVLCHAAIVARELKKPCVIGTEAATLVLKDGDVVEVDAVSGVVKKC